MCRWYASAIVECSRDSDGQPFTLWDVMTKAEAMGHAGIAIAGDMPVRIDPSAWGEELVTTITKFIREQRFFGLHMLTFFMTCFTSEPIASMIWRTPSGVFSIGSSF